MVKILLLQTILTTVVVDKVGFHLEPQDQVFFSFVYCWFICLSLLVDLAIITG